MQLMMMMLDPVTIKSVMNNKYVNSLDDFCLGSRGMVAQRPRHTVRETRDAQNETVFCFLYYSCQHYARTPEYLSYSVPNPAFQKSSILYNILDNTTRSTMSYNNGVKSQLMSDRGTDALKYHLGNCRNMDIRQTRRGWLQEMLLGCEARTEFKYYIDRQQVGHSMENSNCCCRICCVGIHPFQMGMFPVSALSCVALLVGRILRSS